MQRALLPLVVCLFAPACASTEPAVEASAPAGAIARARFERIKALAGDWTGPGPEGIKGAPMEVRYRITSGGNTVEETLMPGTEHEMITMYHLDGGRLVLTHDCAVGNQPRMIAAPPDPSGVDAATIRFEFAGASNLSSEGDGRVHEMELTFEGPDRLKARWIHFQDGKPGHSSLFDLTRKSGITTSRMFSGSF